MVVHTSPIRRVSLCFLIVILMTLAPQSGLAQPLTPIIGVISTEIDFGTIALGTPIYVNEDLFNATGDPTSILEITDISVAGDGFGLLTHPDSLNIPGNGSAVVLPVRFQPTNTDTAAGTLTIVAPGASNSPIVVPMRGKGAEGEVFVIDYDSNGAPVLCGTGIENEPLNGTSFRSWSTIPTVIRADGMDSFIVEIDVGSTVASVTLDDLDSTVVPASGGSPPLTLTDIDGDFVFVSEPLIFNTQESLRPTYWGDPNGPEGLDITLVGNVVVEETTGAFWSFVRNPWVRLLHPATQATVVDTHTDPDVISSPHLVNIRTDRHAASQVLARIPIPSSAYREITLQMYETFPDNAHQIVFLATEYSQRLDGILPLGGLHVSSQRNFTGTGGQMFDATALYGSAGLLLGVNFIGVTGSALTTQVLAHELMHQWAANLDEGFGFRNITGHYHGNTSIRSVLASAAARRNWVPNGSGGFTINCESLFVAPPLDQYLMGLIDGSGVPDIHIAADPGLIPCSSTVTDFSTVTIEDIQYDPVLGHGVRFPGPLTSQKDFMLAFVAETHNRLFNETEMTFFDAMAEHAVKTSPSGSLYTQGWAPITGYYQGQTLESNFPELPPIAVFDSGSSRYRCSLLERARPTVFSGATTIDYTLAEKAPVNLRVYDVAGRLVRELAKTVQGPGRFNVEWDGRHLSGSSVPTGVYFLRLDAGGKAYTSSVVLLK